MAVKARNKKVVVDEMAKLEKGEIEFLFETVKNSMIPGKYLPIAMQVVTKLKNQYKLLDKQDIILKSKEDTQETLQREIKKAQQETYQKIKKVDGELYIDDE